jgi:hypothetical protein
MKKELPRDEDKNDAGNSVEGLGIVLLCYCVKCVQLLFSMCFNFWSVQIVSFVKSSHISASEPMYTIEPLCYSIIVNCISP